MVHKIEYSDNRRSENKVLLYKSYSFLEFKVLGFLKFQGSFLEISRSPLRKEAL